MSVSVDEMCYNLRSSNNVVKDQKMLTIRRADIEDLEQIVALRMAFLREAQPDGLEYEPEVFDLTHRYVADKLSTGEFLVWLAEEDQQVVGTSGLIFFHRPPTFRNRSDMNAYILNMYTIPERRGRGVATMLLRHIIEYVKTTPVKRISLHATQMGMLVYERLGFEDCSGEMTLNLNG